MKREANILAKLGANTPGTDYAQLNKNLKSLNFQIDRASDEWNTVADELDLVLEKCKVL